LYKLQVQNLDRDKIIILGNNSVSVYRGVDVSAYRREKPPYHT